MSQLLSDLRATGGLITAVNGGNNITVNTVAGVATVNVSGTTNHAVQVGNALGALTSIGIGLSGQVLTSNGPGLDPSFQNAAVVLATLTGNAGGPVPPTAGNINVVGDGTTINVLGNPGTSTLTISAIGTGVLETITGNTGGPVSPDASGNLNIVAVNTTVDFQGNAITNTESLQFGISNLVLGDDLSFVTTGVRNVGLGLSVLNALTSGTDNTAIGFGAGTAITTGLHNTAIGSLALDVLTTGSNNTALGDDALSGLLTGSNNIGVGRLAASAFTGVESNNIIIGNIGTVADSATIRLGTTGTQTKCFVAGVAAVVPPGTLNMVTVDTGTGQLGSQALPTGTITSVQTANATPQFVLAGTTETVDFAATSNLLLGSDGASIGVGTSFNTGLGVGALDALTLGATSNTAIGYHALLNDTTSINNTAIGYRSMESITTGTGYNTAVGVQALQLCTTGQENTAIGLFSLDNILSGSRNACLGNSTGQNYTGAESDNILIGHNVLGTLGESAVIRIGTGGVQTTCFIAGIDGVNVGSVAKVITMASNQLGTATITAGTGISITPGANTITIANTSTGLTWTVIAANQTAAVNNGYFCNKAGTLALALPATSAVGDVIEVTNENTALGVQFTQAAGQQILLPNNTSTTLGATGTLTSSAVGDSMKIVCKTANTIWRCVSMNGNWTPA